MSTLVSLELDGHDLDGWQHGTTDCSVGEGFEWPTAQPKREWVEKRIGDVPVPNPSIPHFEIEIPLQLRGTEDEINTEAGAITAICRRAETLAHMGGVDLTAKFSDQSNASTLHVLAGELSKVQVDRNHLGGVASATLKLYCEPWLLGPWATVKSGRAVQGVGATEVQIGSLSGDIPGPARITLTNKGSNAQQFAMLGLDGTGYAASNKLVLTADTFDYSTAPLNGTYTAGTNEVQTATKSGTISGGTFTLTYEGQTTSSLAYNASTATVKAALEALSTIGSGNIDVGGTTLNLGNMTFTFKGTLAASDVSLIVLNSSLTGGGSAPITQTTQGASGYVANTWLQGSWSDFMRTAAQTDTGSFQLWALVYTDAEVSQARVRASISIGDTARATINKGAAVVGTGNPVWVNLGPVHAKNRISSGSYQWTATIGGMTVGTVGSDLRILKLVKVPIENGVAVARAPGSSVMTLVLSDDFNQSAGSITGKSMDLGGTWSGAGDSDDFTVDTTNHRIQRTATSDASQWDGRLIYGATTFTGCTASLFVDVPDADGMYGGIVARYVDMDNFLAAYMSYSATVATYAIAIAKVVGGTATVIASAATSAPYGQINLTVQSNGNFSLTSGFTPTLSGNDNNLAAGGALESGKCGIYDANTSATVDSRNYDFFSAYAISSPDAAIHPSQDLVWQPDGNVEREASGGTYFAPAAGVQQAGIPLLQPATSAGYTNRLLIASADFNPDVAASGNPSPPLDYTVEHRPAYAIGRH